MIRRITRNNDYKDIIKSCPVGVIDYVYRVDYYVSGHPEVFVEMTPVKVGEHLEVVLSTEALVNLTYNGVLMRRAYYSQADPDYPDDSYDLEFVDNMNVWLGEEDTAAPFDPGYLTEDDLKTINGESIVGEGNIEISVPDYYATKSWVSDQGYLTSVPSGYATESWVSDQNYMNMEEMANYLTAYAYATEDWVRGQDYISSIPSEYATQSWVLSQSYMTEDAVRWILGGEGEDNPVMREEDLSTYATMAWVSDQGYLTSVVLSGYATQSWVSSNFLSTTALTGYATESWVSSNYVSTTTLSSYTTFTDIDSYISSFWYRAAEEFYSDYVPRREIGSYLSGYATESWVSSNFLSTTALTGYATESWVQSQGYLTSVPSGYATESWVSSNFLSSTALSEYATEAWVNTQIGTEEITILGIVSNNYLALSKIWTGTSSQWAELTSEQQATYTIALVTE